MESADLDNYKEQGSLEIHSHSGNTGRVSFAQGTIAGPTASFNSKSAKERPNQSHLIPFIALFFACVLLCLPYSRLSSNYHLSVPWSSHPAWSAADPYAHIRGYCAHTQPINSSEFLSRQSKLAHILQEENAIYVAEPGANGLYFANISSSVWHLSERPLLFVLLPAKSAFSSVSENPQITVLTPKFESTRAKLLSIPARGNTTFLEWAEDVNPFGALAGHIPSEFQTIYVDEKMRAFVWKGLQDAFPTAKVEVAPSTIRSLRERKSAAELALLRCANEATLLAIRAVRHRLELGVRESEVQSMMIDAIRATGQVTDGPLVLFGSNAAFPHGAGSDRLLGVHDLILIDAGGSLHGYWSDITRTFALESSLIQTVDLVAWYIVQAAQQAAHKAAREGTRGMDVDHAARLVIEHARYGPAFTHRLGHGIGLEGHESPYLVGGNEQKLETGNTFSNEPGVYLEGKVGIRLEDIFVVSEDGTPEYLTSGVGGPAVSPWKP